MKSWADVINGSAEFDAYLSRSKSKDGAGMVTSDSRGTDFMHKYNLSLDSSLFPLLKLSAGSTFLQDINTMHDMGTSSRSKSTTLSPYLDLMLNNSLYQAALGYSRNQNWQSGTQELVPSTVNDEYHASFGWRPVGLPDLSVRLSHANTFDVDRVTQDMTTNMATLGSQYTYKALKLGYQFTGTETMDNLHGTDNTSLLNNGSVGYSDQFFNRRVSVYAHYNLNHLTSTTKAGNGGFVDTEAINYDTWLYSHNFDQSQSTGDTELKSDDLKSVGINLLPPDPLAVWGVGLGFSNPTEINKLKVFVSVSGSNLTSSYLLQQMKSYFTWQIWLKDKDTDNWRMSNVTVTATPEFNQSQQWFTLDLNAPVKTKYIKVVVNWPIMNVDPKWNGVQIKVTDLQAFLSQPAAQVQGTSSRFSQTFNTDVRTKITDSLYHNLNLSLSNTTGGELAYVLDNNLTYDHRLNSMFTVGASAGREDLLSGGLHSSAYLYSASLKATPLPGLNNALVYSGRIDQAVNGTSESNSIFLTNTAQPYKGVAFNLSGGYSLSTDARGQKSENLSFVSGASIAPRQDLNFTMSYNRSLTSASGGTPGLGASAAITGASQSGQMGATYRPFPNLYLFASLGIQQAESKKTQYIQNYGGTWSPFPDGALQFNIAYNESANSTNNEKNSSLTPSISWKVAPKAMLSLSYSLLRTDSLVASTEASYLSTVLRLSF
ncbi:hypothetical protein [Geotalea sp. SG265]|uniref:hypothetical protein n=1 Tax=Geotalea sp. SG265 TaxID=2922867 RepID=UPI001FAFA726|nr:hypothetical protein [Geotalea sp. SG265]